MMEGLSAKARQSQLVRLFLVSFGALALEVMLIRWVAAEIRVFAYLKNLILMACLLGLGMGCASPAVGKDEGKGHVAPLEFPIFLTIVVAIVATAMYTGVYNISLLIDRDLFDFNVGVSSVAALGFNVTCICVIFILVTATFDFLGLELGCQLHGLPPLPAYTANLLGSLAGVISLAVMSYLQLPPAVWFIVSMAPIAVVYATNKKGMAVFAVSAAVSLGLICFSTQSSLWSPYYRIDLVPLNYYLKDNNMITVPYQLGTVVEVDHSHHQRAINFTSAFLNQHPELKESNEYVTYNLPYFAVPNPKNVLILGAGTGNDVSAALRNGAEHIDAIEIDPVILKLGHSIHPEKPYENPRAEAHQDDACSFLAHTHTNYDVIEFGYLDSQTALSAMSSVRLDNYLYTRESLLAATHHLSPDGIACLNFSTQPDWLRARLYQLVKSVWDGQPLAFNTHYSAPNAIMVVWGPGLDAVRGKLEQRYAKMLVDPKTLMTPVEVPTDDWPFLYQRARNLPWLSIAILMFIVGTSTILVGMRFRLHPKTLIGNLQFFLLGAGFLLMETRAMLSVAILFSSTWIVNSIVIALVLMMATLSTWFVTKTKLLTQTQAYALLIVALVIMYAVPLGSLSGYPILLKLLAAGAVLGAPFFCSGVVFARAFSETKQPAIALGVNILGAILGGCLEYLSVVVGINGLTLLALSVYLLSWLARRFTARS